MAAREKTKAFKEAATAAGLKQAAIDNLLAEDFNTVEAVKLLSTDDIAGLGLSKGQTRTTEAWVRSLCSPHVAVDFQPSHEITDPGTTNGLNGGQDDRVHADLLLAGHDDALWDVQDNAAQNGRPYFIHDFISRISYDDQERALCTQGATQLVLRTTRKKPAPDAVTLPQWVSANARIMAKLITDGALKSNEELLDYLQYVADFGDYAQVNQIESAMLYDHEYRRKQAKKGRRWGEDDIHLANFYLQRKSTPTSTRTTSAQNSPPRLLDNQGTEICRNYNASGCYRSQCVYSHVCAACKQRGHNKRSHYDQRPATAAQGAVPASNPSNNRH